MQKFKQILHSSVFLWILLIGVVVGGFAVRLYKIQNPVADWHSWRQADTASVTRIYLDKGLDLLHPRYQDLSDLQTGYYNPEGWRFVEFPIFNAAHYLAVKLYPSISFDEWGRLISVFCSLASTILLFLLGKRFLGKWGGFLAAFLFAFMPFNIYFSRVILPEPMSVLFTLLSLYFFVRWFDKESLGSFIASSIFFALALLVKPYVIFYAIPMLWLLLTKYEFDVIRIIRSKHAWLFAGIALVPVLLWRIWMAQYPEGIPFYKWVFNLFNIRFKPSFWYWIFGERIGKMILGDWMVPLFTLGALLPSKKGEQWFPLMMGLAAFSYVSVIAAANVRHDYYQTIIIPAVCLLVAKGAVELWGRREFLQPAARIAVLVMVLWGLYFPWSLIKGNYQINHAEIITAGEAVDKIAAPDAKVVAPYNGDTAFLYQTKRMGWPIQREPVESLVEKGADYYVSVNLNDPQTQDAMRKFEIPVQTDQYVIIDLNQKRKAKN